MPAQKKLLTENWQRRFRGPYRKADSTDAFGDSWRGPYQPDTADGQTTSPQPPPFTLPRTLDQMSSSTSPSHSPSSGQPQILDRSQSAPAAMEQASAPEQCHNQPGIQELPLHLPEAEDAGSTAHQVHPHPLHVHSSSKMSPLPSPETDVLPTCTSSANMTTMPQYPEGDILSRTSEGDAESFEVLNGSMLTQAEELPPSQPMDQETAESVTADITEASLSPRSQSGSVDMECPVPSDGVVTSERDQPEGERSFSSDNIPSLAAALMELHELLVSNNRAQAHNRSTSCSPSCPFIQDTDEVAEPCTPSSITTQSTPSSAITAGAEPSDAKANDAAAVSDEGPSTCLMPDPSGCNEHLGGDTAETVGTQGPPQHPDVSGEWRADRCGQDEASNISAPQLEPEIPPDPAGDLEFREPPEGQQERGVADGRDSGTNTPDTLQTEHTFLSPLSLAVGSPEEVSCISSSSVPPLAQAPQPASPAPLLPSPHPFIEQFPAEHIQRIQAAGFSAREAAEALEQAHGVVELALLALLARSITVPT
ncbi:protein DDI1 homolog 2 isoform X1 [Anabas testudineus]|uniref:protein DDI1 homolog 2 isoform X1 n=1 Tax=Anabas testudineus TaxID=64144 RepID=UPI000E457AD4|nr:protein DDI1 homolog 2 isoform X1 [Anabas testudineus]